MNTSCPHHHHHPAQVDHEAFQRMAQEHAASKKEHRELELKVKQ